MSARTGLLDIEVALLTDVQAAIAPIGEPVGSTRVLAAIEGSGLLGPRHAYAYLRDLAVPWHRHLPLVDGVGNWGSQGGDTAADASYTLVGLSALGVLALAAERGEVGPVPEQAVPDPPPGMPPPGVEGGWWSSVSVPSPVVAPAVIIAATGASGGPDPARIDRLVVTEVPYGVDVDEVIRQLAQRIQQEDGSTERPPGYRGASEPALRFPRAPVQYVSDETTHRNGLRIVCVLHRGADPDAAREWVLSTWPLTITADARLPRPLADLERLLGA